MATQPVSHMLWPWLALLAFVAGICWIIAGVVHRWRGAGWEICRGRYSAWQQGERMRLRLR